jgi:hypothetical protein
MSFDRKYFYIGGSGGDGFPIVSFDDRRATPELVSVSTASTNSNPGTTWTAFTNFTVPETEKNTLLIVNVATEGNDAPAVYAEYNGVRLSRIQTAFNPAATPSLDIYWTSFAIVGPPPGTKDLVIYLPNGQSPLLAFASLFRNVSQTCPFGRCSYVTDESAGNPVFVSFVGGTFTDNSLAYIGACMKGGDTDPWTIDTAGTIKIAEVQSGTSASTDNTAVCGTYATNSGSKNVTTSIQFTASSSDESSTFGFELMPANHPCSHFDAYTIPSKQYEIAGPSQTSFNQGVGNVEQVIFPSGTKSVPGIAFNPTSVNTVPYWDCGFHSPTVDEIHVSIAATNIVEWTDQGMGLTLAGTKSLPSCYFSADINTGFFRPVIDQIAIAAGGVEMMRFLERGTSGDQISMLSLDESGSKDSNVGIGLATMTTVPQAKLHVHGSGWFENHAVRAAGFYIDGKGEVDTMLAGSGITLTPGAAGTTIASSGGTVTFKETESGGYSAAADTLAFLSSDFYLSAGGDGKPIVALVSAGGGGASATSEVFGSAVEWQMTHNLNTTAILWSAYDDGNLALLPATVDVSDPNTAYFYFAVAVAGTAVVIG